MQGNAANDMSIASPNVVSGNGGNLNYGTVSDVGMSQSIDFGGSGAQRP